MNYVKYLEVICNIMDCAIKNKKCDLSIYDNDVLFHKVIKEQALFPFLYKVDTRKIWRSYFYQNFIISENFDKISNEIKELLNSNSIKHLFFKGNVLKHLYLDPAMRSMGDIDFLVEKRNYKRTIKLLIDNGYKIVSKEDYHLCLIKNNLCVEIHNSLFSKKSEFYKYFRNVFNDASQLDNSFTYDLNINVHLVYILCHYLKHLRLGAGLRELCDIYLLLNSDNIDTNIVKDYMKIMKLENYFNTILNELYFIFGYDAIPFQENTFTKELLEFSLISGIHGHGENSAMEVNELHSTKHNKFTFLLSKLFIPIPKLFQQYPWTKSIILIPFGYLIRLVYLIFNRGHKVNKILKTSNNSELFKNTGLSR